MTYRSFSLIPTFGNNLISDRFTQIDNLFSRLTGETPLDNIPNYNLFKKDKEYYELTISVPGYKQNELDISILNNKLNIIGKPIIEEIKNNNIKNKIQWLHKSIIKNEFSLSFNFEHRIIVEKTSLKEGLLKLIFNCDVPEQEKPKKIFIDNQNEFKKTLIHNIS